MFRVNSLVLTSSTKQFRSVNFLLNVFFFQSNSRIKKSTSIPGRRLVLHFWIVETPESVCKSCSVRTYVTGCSIIWRSAQILAHAHITEIQRQFYLSFTAQNCQIYLRKKESNKSCARALRRLNCDETEKWTLLHNIEHLVRMYRNRAFCILHE